MIKTEKINSRKNLFKNFKNLIVSLQDEQKKEIFATESISEVTKV